jgi:4-amino-4-deoxy-L-arabinose transferase-like glycosyltransferase
VPKAEPTRDRRFAVGLAAIALLGLAWRLYYVLRWKGSDADLSDEGDALYYGGQAILNARGDLFEHPFRGGPAADHPPLTSLLLTPASRLWPDSVLAQRLTMVFIGTAAVVVIGLVGRRAASDRAGLLAAGIAAAYAALWMNDGLLMAEAPAALLTAVLLLLALSLTEAVTMRAIVALGVIAGIAALTRAELLLLLPLLLVVPLLRHGESWSHRLRLTVVAGCAAGLVLLPWVAWNLSRFEEPTFLSTNDGLTVLGANCPSTYYTATIGFWDLRCALDSPVEGDPSVESAEWRRQGLSYLRDNVGRLPKVTVARVGRVWGVYEPRQMVFFNNGEGREAWASWVGLYQEWLLVPFAVAGAVVLRRRGQPIAPYVATACTVTFTAALFYGIVRFRVPADVSMAVLAGVAVDAGLGRLGSRPKRPTAANTTNATSAGSLNRTLP